jgi:hypothetical protein
MWIWTLRLRFVLSGVGLNVDLALRGDTGAHVRVRAMACVRKKLSSSILIPITFWEFWDSIDLQYLML